MLPMHVTLKAGVMITVHNNRVSTRQELTVLQDLGCQLYWSICLMVLNKMAKLATYYDNKVTYFKTTQRSHKVLK